MSEVDFYLLPIENIKEISSMQIMNLSDMVERIKDNSDSFIVPNEFFTCEDNNKDVIYNHYFDKSDEMRLLIETISKCDSYCGSYNDLYTDEQDYKAYISIDNIPQKIEEKCASNEDEVISIYRGMVDDSFDYERFIKWRLRCFPNLCFTQDTVSNANSIGSFSDNRIDIMKSLSILNDIDDSILASYNEAERLNYLEKESKVHCTGKGSNEKSTFKKSILFSPDNKEDNLIKKYTVSCIPHFKLDTQYSNKRLHFSWGRNEILNHRVIVVHIGQHWKDDINGKESKLMPDKCC